MAEDGVAPYYFNSLERGWEEPVWGESKLRNWIISKLKGDSTFKSRSVNTLWLAKPLWVCKELMLEMSVEAAPLNKYGFNKSFGLIDKLFTSEDTFIPKNIDIVLFDHVYHDLLDEEVDWRLHHELFSQCRGLTVFVKLRPSNENLNNLKQTSRKFFFERLRDDCRFRIILSSSSSNLPWELLYYRNLDRLKDSLLLSWYFTTALISSEILFDSKNVAYDLSELLYTHVGGSKVRPAVMDLVDRINRDSTSRKIYMPSSFSELGKLLKKAKEFAN